MNEVVPRITDNLRARLTANGYGEPVTVAFEHRPDCSFGQCWQNVQTTIQREGGSLVAGRIVWQQEHGLWLHLEAHSVWRTPYGRLVDPTPKADGENEIVFVEESIQHIGVAVIPCRYIVMSKSVKVRRFVELLERRTAITVTALSGSQPLDTDTLDEMVQLSAESAELGMDLFPQEYMRMLRQAQMAISVIDGLDRP